MAKDTTAGVRSAASVHEAIDAAHHELWKRFIDPQGIMYDYAGLDGHVVLPTPEECQQGKPNALGWWTTIENGAFFSGLYLDALCNRWRVSHGDDTKAEARKVVAGLLLLSRIGKTSGFIGRGVAADGQSHYAIGSDDQTLPWLYGLWRYVHSGIPTADERTAIIKQMVVVMTAVKQAGWCMPSDEDFGVRGGWRGEDAREASRLLFAARAMYDMTNDATWLADYRRLASETLPKTGKTRVELCAQGMTFRFDDDNILWTSASSQAALHALVEMETDTSLQAQYRKGLLANATNALPAIAKYARLHEQSQATFSPDWRPLNAFWQPQTTVNDAVQVAMKEVPTWSSTISPRRMEENAGMREPLFACWTVALCDDETLLATARPQIDAALTSYRWNTLYTSAFFAAECTYYALQR